MFFVVFFFFFCPSASLNKHKGPVWQLRWVEQDRGAAGDKKERLMCISGDGRMTQWFIQQRLDCSGEHLTLPSVIPADIFDPNYPTKHLRAAGQPKAARDKTSCSLHRCDDNQENREWEEKIARWERREEWSSHVTRGSWDVLWLPSRGRLRKPSLAEGLPRKTLQESWAAQLELLSGTWRCYLKHIKIISLLNY